MHVRLTKPSIFSLPSVESMISDYSFNLFKSYKKQSTRSKVQVCYKKQSTDMLFLPLLRDLLSLFAKPLSVSFSISCTFDT